MQNPLTLSPLCLSNPSGAAALRGAAVVWFRNDLRIHDNECLTVANNESLSVLPVYCFDPRDYGKSSSGFDKTGPNRATFFIESVSDLRKNLQARGSDLVVRIGKPDTVLLEMTRAVGADAVYMHREVSRDDVKAEEKIEDVMKDEGVEVKCFWGSTLYHLEDLPFELEKMPTAYGPFRERVKGLTVRKTIEAPNIMKGLPNRGDVELGNIPILADLVENVKPVADASLVGGETEALLRVRNFANNGFKTEANKSIYDANFSCELSPWLAVGCLSPRFMFDELKKSASCMISATSETSGSEVSESDSGMNGLIFELLWRDFFRFITKKYTSSKQQSYLQ